MVAVLAALAVGDITALPDLFHPAPWQGFRPADLVAPFLLFASGTALACTRVRHRTAEAAAKRLARRCLVLIGAAAGIAYLAGAPLATLDPAGPLPRIAIAWLAVWFVAGLPRWTQGAIAGALLLGHWFVLSRVDLPDPDGIVTLPTIVVTVLAGYWFGDWLRGRPDGPATAVATALSGVYVGAAGIVGAQILPLNRTLWTATFVLFTAGAALVTFAGVYALVTVLPLGRPLRQVTTLGRHAFVAYVVVAAATTALGVGVEGSWWQRLVTGFGDTFGAQLGALLLAAAVVTAAVLLVGAVDRRGWYLRA